MVQRIVDCAQCDILDKLRYCCACHPETGESVDVVVKGQLLNACPNLDYQGKCAVYEERPEVCRRYLCPKVTTIKERMDALNP